MQKNLFFIFSFLNFHLMIQCTINVKFLPTEVFYLCLPGKQQKKQAHDLVPSLNDPRNTPANDGCLEKLSYCMPPFTKFLHSYHMVTICSTFILKRRGSVLARYVAIEESDFSGP